MNESLLFLLGLITGFIGTNTGGSSLVTVPILISLGISPPSAVATARVASIGTMIAGLSQFHKHGKVDYRLAIPACVFAIAGSFTGAYLLLVVPSSFLQKSMGVYTLFFTIFSFIKKEKIDDKPFGYGLQIIGYCLFFLTGLVGGFMGGQAILATYIFLIIFNKSLLESIGTRKVTGLAVSITSVLFYGVHELICWHWAAALVCGTLIGSFMGSQYAIKKGDQWIRKIFAIISTFFSIKLLFF